MPTSLIIGSGPAAAGAARSPRDRTQKIVVLDIGGSLEADRRRIRDRIAQQPSRIGPKTVLGRIAYQPVVERRKSLPEKWSYGSNFRFAMSGNLKGYVQ